MPKRGDPLKAGAAKRAHHRPSMTPRPIRYPERLHSPASPSPSKHAAAEFSAAGGRASRERSSGLRQRSIAASVCAVITGIRATNVVLLFGAKKKLVGVKSRTPWSAGKKYLTSLIIIASLLVFRHERSGPRTRRPSHSTRTDNRQLRARSSPSPHTLQLVPALCCPNPIRTNTTASRVPR